MADRKNIQSGKGEQLSEEELLRYLHHAVPDEERRLMEQKISSDPFESDAIDGLSAIESKENIENHVHHLQNKLRQITSRKPRREKGTIKVFEWTVLAAMILLFLCVIGYLLITLYHSPGYHTKAGVSSSPVSIVPQPS
jgi:hypothetical protein